MSWTRYLFHDFWTARELNEIDEEFARQQSSRRRETRDQSRRIAELEDDVGRLVLLTRTLTDLLTEKGVATQAELLECFRRIDLLDGKEDGRLDTKHLRGSSSGEQPKKRNAPPIRLFLQREFEKRQSPDEKEESE